MKHNKGISIVSQPTQSNYTYFKLQLKYGSPWLFELFTYNLPESLLAYDEMESRSSSRTHLIQSIKYFLQFPSCQSRLISENFTKMVFIENTNELQCMFSVLYL